MTSRASVGFFAMMDREACTNQGFINVAPHDEEIRLYVLFNLINRVPEIRSNAQGATYPEISKGRFREMDVVIPKRAVATEFSRTASEVIDQLRCLKRSTSALTQARDIHLLRLMSGEVAGMNRAAVAELINVGKGITTEFMRSGHVGARAGDARTRQRGRRDESARSDERWRGGRDGRSGRKFPVRMTETR